MDDRTKRYAHHALGYHTLLLTGLADMANAEDEQSGRERWESLKAGFQTALSGAGPLLEEQIDAWKHHQKHPIPGFFPLAARAWEFICAARDEHMRPSHFRDTLSELISELQEAEERALADLSAAGYSPPPPFPEPTVASGEAAIEAAACTCDAQMLTTLLEAKTAYLEAKKKTDQAHGAAARALAWERACFRRMGELRK
jgi:hypothetical protein